jgi:hypothetical protein
MIRAVLAATLLATLSGGTGIVDDFEQPLNRQWIVSRPERTYLAASQDPQHGHVLVLEPAGDACMCC